MNNEDQFANFNPSKTYEEEFNPFFFMDKIDRTKLSSERSNTDWKLHIDYNFYHAQFEEAIHALNADIVKQEKEQKERTDKQGINNRRFKVNAYDNHVTFYSL